MNIFARLLLIAAVVGAIVMVAVLATGNDDEAPRYNIVLDNTFGLTVGSEIRVAGVEAGTLQDIRLDKRNLRPIVEFELAETGFGDLRRDATCQARPQSLIGEYFLDCAPGTGPRLPENGTIPVEQTSSVVPPDLIQNIMRRPYRERASIIFTELGIALAGRGGDLNETIRRASPALREVNRVLATLAEQRLNIRSLYENADKVLAEVADRRKDVSRFVGEARDTARVYASQADNVSRQLELFPTFLDELRPTLNALEGTADAQRPALSALRVAAPALTATLRTSSAFSRASRPNIRSLAALARRGKQSVEIARPNLRRLARAVGPLPETAGNLGIILDHLNDPKWASEKDARAPRTNGGFTGIENFARFGYGLSQTTNWFDDDSYLLKIQQFTDDECGAYADANRAREISARCRAWMGPNQPGVNKPDPTATEPEETETRRAQRERAAVQQTSFQSEEREATDLLDFLMAP